MCIGILRNLFIINTMHGPPDLCELVELSHCCPYMFFFYSSVYYKIMDHHFHVRWHNKFAFTSEYNCGIICPVFWRVCFDQVNIIIIKLTLSCLSSRPTQVQFLWLWIPMRSWISTPQNRSILTETKRLGNCHHIFLPLQTIATATWNATSTTSVLSSGVWEVHVCE